MNIWQQWLTGQALPLWGAAGFDARRGLFHERLALSGVPETLPALRLMVQARQIATFCRATLDGLAPDTMGARALACLAVVEQRFWHADGAPGWIFSLGPDETPADRTRDLYAHSFVLLAYAWAYRLSGDAAHLRTARATLDEIDAIFGAENGGYLDAVPAPDAIRRQNPHMHLLEAYLALYEASGEAVYLGHARAMVDLALDRMIAPESGMLLEYFDADWRPLHPAGRNAAEPGHLFEWAWLFTEFRRLAPADARAADVEQAGLRLFEAGLVHGVDPATTAVREAMTEDGAVTDSSSRIWQQTEFLRILSTRPDDDVARSMAARCTERFFALHATPRLKGGWIDRVDAQGAPLIGTMPASSLYHIYGAADALPAGWISGT